MKKCIKSSFLFVIIILVLLFIRTFIITPIIVSGSSMEPTLLDKDVLLLNKFDKEYKRFDIVVIKLDDEYLIKRIIALPGETIECVDNVIYINNIPIKNTHSYGITSDFNIIQLSEGEYFVLGDNRMLSYDSRSFGKITKEEIKGKTNLTIYPFDKLGKIN